MSPSWAPREPRFCPVVAKTSHLTVKRAGWGGGVHAQYKWKKRLMYSKHLICIEGRCAFLSRRRPSSGKQTISPAPLAYLNDLSRRTNAMSVFSCQWTIVSLLKTHCYFPFSPICPSLQAHGGIKWTVLETMLRTCWFDATWLYHLQWPPKHGKQAASYWRNS